MEKGNVQKINVCGANIKAVLQFKNWAQSEIISWVF
jgi:hypothetical protein